MRISDWSSDVCSSDLSARWRRALARASPPRADRPARGRRCRAAAPRRRSAEIGRASCRERVCQYVSISVVAVSLKKKTTKHTGSHVYDTNPSHYQTTPNKDCTDVYTPTNTKKH